MFGVPRAASRLALRLRFAVVLMGVLVAAWVVAGLRLCLVPPDGLGAEVSLLHALGAAINAVVLGFLAIWVWRAERWATWSAVLVLLVNGLLVLQPRMTAGYPLLLGLTLVTVLVIASLLLYPQLPPEF